MDVRASDPFISLCHDNASDNSITDEVWELGEYRMSGIVLAVFQTIFLLIGLPWNLMVIVTIVKEKLYKQPTIVLLLNLAINDLLILVMVIPSSIITGAAGEYIIGDSDAARCRTCKIGFLNTLFYFMSFLTVVIMSLDRFLYIYKPLQYDRIITLQRILVTLLVTWIPTFSFAAVPLFGIKFGYIVFIPQFTICMIDITGPGGAGTFYFYIILILAIPLLVLLILWNVGVVCIVRKNIRAVYATNKSLNDMGSVDFNKEMKKKRKEKQFHLIQVFGAILCADLVLWVPFVIVTPLCLIIGVNKIPTFILVITQILFILQITVHPILETTLISDVRNPLKKTILWFCSRNDRKLSNSEMNYCSACYNAVCCIRKSDRSPPSSGSLKANTSNVVVSGTIDKL